MSKKKARLGLANLSCVAALDADDLKTIHVVIETPKGSRNKYAFDDERRLFVLKKVLPVGMAFPYDFGFVPSTRAEDGDPVDVLVLMDEPAFPGCLLTCRPVGLIEGEQRTHKKQIRNDRIVAIETDNHSYARITHIDDLGKPFIDELCSFFVNYHGLSDEQYRVLAVKGPRAARERVRVGMHAVRRRA
jgi:inorganic pyrophosphatase